MGQSTKNWWTRMCASVKNGILGKALAVLVLLLVLGIADCVIFQPKITAGSEDATNLMINKITLLLFTFLLAVVIFGDSLVSEKIQAGVTKQRSKDAAEIEKIKLEICKIKCERELVESKNNQRESEKENQKSAVEN